MKLLMYKIMYYNFSKFIIIHLSIHLKYQLSVKYNCITSTFYND
jgi:hypothetical protein